MLSKGFGTPGGSPEEGGGGRGCQIFAVLSSNFFSSWRRLLERKENQMKEKRLPLRRTFFELVELLERTLEGEEEED